MKSIREEVNLVKQWCWQRNVKDQWQELEGEKRRRMKGRRDKKAEKAGVQWKQRRRIRRRHQQQSISECECEERESRRRVSLLESSIRLPTFSILLPLFSFLTTTNFSSRLGFCCGNLSRFHRNDCSIQGIVSHNELGGIVVLSEGIFLSGERNRMCYESVKLWPTVAQTFAGCCLFSQNILEDFHLQKTWTVMRWWKSMEINAFRRGLSLQSTEKIS